MKTKTILGSVLTASLFAGCAWEKNDQADENKLMAEAKVSKEAAQQTALAKVPGGTVKESELEKEHGNLQWSFDIAAPASKNIQEVAVNALTGEVLSVDTETPEDQAKEAAEDAAKKKAGDKEDKD
jgi:hypothetical protein